jgi:hypothetical protein
MSRPIGCGISPRVSIFPPARTVSVVVDGRPLVAYHRAFEVGGRTYAPLRPYVSRIAERMWYVGDVLVIQRGARYAYVRMASRTPGALASTYVPLAPMLRALGACVQYDDGVVEVRLSAHQRIALPTPFNPSVPSVAPHSVFTPEPIVTARPVWSGSALPRRTPIPVIVPTPP